MISNAESPVTTEPAAPDTQVAPENQNTLTLAATSPARDEGPSMNASRRAWAALHAHNDSVWAAMNPDQQLQALRVARENGKPGTRSWAVTMLRRLNTELYTTICQGIGETPRHSRTRRRQNICRMVGDSVQCDVPMILYTLPAGQKITYIPRGTDSRGRVEVIIAMPYDEMVNLVDAQRREEDLKAKIKALEAGQEKLLLRLKDRENELRTLAAAQNVLTKYAQNNGR